MQNKVIEKFQRARAVLLEKKDGLKNIEKLAEETKKAFDDTIAAILAKRNIFKELEAKRKQLKQWRISIYETFFPINYRHLASMPFIYMMTVPMFVFDICLEIYHQVCFRLYGIPLVKRRDYFVYDRQKLPYLNWYEKLNCFYCSYANNLMRYGAEIAGRTERFWCPIKHAKSIDNAHSQYPKFVDYLDGENFREKWEGLRDFSDIKDKEKNHD
jgi:hypothetical protein